MLWFQDESAQGTVEELCVVTGYSESQWGRLTPAAWDDPTVDLADGNRAQLFPCPPQSNAKPTGDTSKPVNGVWVQYDRGTIKLKNTNTCLDLKDGNTGEGGHVQQWRCYRGEWGEVGRRGSERADGRQPEPAVDRGQQGPRRIVGPDDGDRTLETRTLDAYVQPTSQSSNLFSAERQTDRGARHSLPASARVRRQLWRGLMARAAFRTIPHATAQGRVEDRSNIHLSQLV